MMLQKNIAKKSFLLSVILLGVVFAGAQAGVLSSQPNQEGKTITTTIAPMLQKVMPCVVNIVARGGDANALMTPPPASPSEPPSSNNDSNRPQDNMDPRQNQNPSLPPMHADPNQPFVSMGSGVIVDAAHGYILTNDHLLKNATSITVNLSDGRKVQAKLIGRDALTDLAVVQIAAERLQAIQFGDSDKAKVGDFVAAIGNPFGLTQTVTSGIVSALQRTELDIEGPQGYESFIQTDAAINPGNSGGALVSLDGGLLGINTAILAPTGSNVGIGFAIPSNMAKNVMMQLIHYGSLQRGMVGIMLQDFTDELAQAFKLPHMPGAVVTAVTPDSPAAHGGVLVGDIIGQVNDAKVSGAAMVRNTIGLVRSGGAVKLSVLRDGKPLHLEITTVDPQKIEAKIRASDKFLYGIGMLNFDQQVPMQGHVQGVLINHLSEDSPGWHSGLAPGDVIVSANQQPVHNIVELQAMAAKSKEHLLLNIHRVGGALFIAVKADPK